MKMLKYISGLLCLLAVMTACEADNYPEPKETFCGKIVDKDTKEPFQTAMGATGVRIRMFEYSWREENPDPYDFYVKQDGTFNNTKIFKGEYGVIPQGAFVPLVEERFPIKGKVEKTYEVDPLLRIEWVGEPVVNADGTADVTVIIRRGTSDAAYQQPLKEAWLFVSEVSYVGDFSKSPSLSTKLDGVNLPVLDTPVTIRTGLPNGPGSASNLFPNYSRKYFLRIGARTDITIIGKSIFNYTTIKEVTTIAR